MGQLEDTQDERANWHWRNSMRPVRFFALDARASIPVFITLFFFRPITVFLTIVTLVVFYMMERRGLSFDASLRTFRTWFLGQKRPGWLPMRRRRMVDFG